MTANTGWKILPGDCIDLLADLAPESVDAVVTDPPYAISNFHSGDETWHAEAIRNQARSADGGHLSLGDGFERWCERWAAGCLRAMRPGAHMIAFGAPRTFHRLVTGVEKAGFEIRDVLMWLYSSGMPKSRRLPSDRGTALKPAYEPVLIARKRLEGTVEETIEAHGTGALEIGSCRTHDRWPANVAFSHASGCQPGRCRPGCPVATVEAGGHERRPGSRLSVERVFYCSKASRRERDTGCDELPSRRLDLFPRAGHREGRSRPARNHHPTVKPIEVMRWLIRLCCPEEGLVLDPFCGSGTTGAAATIEGRTFIGIEKDERFTEIANARISHWSRRRPEADRDPLNGGAR